MKWWNVDLPNLTSIISSGGYNFYNPRSVTLESSFVLTTLKYRYSKSSKCQFSSFIPVCSIENNQEYWWIELIWFIHRCIFQTHWSNQIISQLSHRRECKKWMIKYFECYFCIQTSVYTFFYSLNRHCGDQYYFTVAYLLIVNSDFNRIFTV